MNADDRGDDSARREFHDNDDDAICFDRDEYNKKSEADMDALIAHAKAGANIQTSPYW